MFPKLFNGCKSFVYIPDISKWEMSNVKSIYAMFNNYKSLSILPDISKWKINDVESISYMFNNFISLQILQNGIMIILVTQVTHPVIVYHYHIFLKFLLISKNH